MILFPVNMNFSINIKYCGFLHLFLISNAWSLIESNLKGFDDSVLYSISWPGADVDQDSQLKFQELVVQTDKHEKYKCLIPQIIEKEKDTIEKYSGPNPLDLLMELFNQPSCSFRLEPYWSYELCHGKYMRQYHEEREGKKLKMQEYYLGLWDKTQHEKLREALELEEKTKPGQPAPIKKIDGLNMPYLQLNMTDGTPCDLISKPRSTKILYVCYALGKHEIYSFKETSICEYEVVVLSPLLCTHPRYRPQDSGENAIKCLPLENAAAKPKSLLKLEAESLKLRNQKMSDGGNQIVYAIYTEPSSKDGVPRVRVEALPIGLNRGEVAEGDPMNQLSSSFPADPIDINAYNNFVTGRECIQGGSGWWKYEFCYGKSVTQYHVEKDGSKTVVDLGMFLKSGHLKWLAANPHKRPVKGSHVSYMYTKGSVCEATGLPRQTEVKLKCVEHRGSPGAVSLYLLEPRMCNYILGVESQLICRLLQNVDEDGLLIHEETIGFSRADHNNDYKPVTEQTSAASAKSTSAPQGKKGIKVTVVLMDEDNLDNHIPDGDE